MQFHQGQKLKNLLERANTNFVHLSNKTGLSRSTIYNYFAMEEIPRKKLLPILVAAGVEENDFFNNELNDPKAEYRRLQEKVKSLEQMVKDKEVIILNQQEIIDLLKQSKQKK